MILKTGDKFSTKIPMIQIIDLLIPLDKVLNYPGNPLMSLLWFN